ncbi:MAG: type VI secretion system contractile sheath large subunit [Acidobacteria bacterium]|nr:type VI secretion system contractile sheath large subunit [Acidobacteriota bacterium]
MNIQPFLGGARVKEDLQFQFCILGNFTGQHEERPSYELKAVNRNTWDSLFTDLKPSVRTVISLPAVSDFEVELVFTGLQGFSEKGVVSAVPFLSDLQAAIQAFGAASEEQPLDVNALLSNHSPLNVVKTMAMKTSQGPALDLLNMVDIGDEEDDGPQLPQLKAAFSEGTYQGHKRQAVVHELEGLKAEVLRQIQKDARFDELHAHWRGLKSVFGSLGKNVKLSLIDCDKDELCDAFFLTFVKPDSGDAARLDLAATSFEFTKMESDLHTLYHLGRMAESVSVPVLLNASPALFGVRSFQHMQHMHDFSSRLSGPDYAKWRKQRDETGSRWLFLCVNKFSQDDGAVWAPGSFAMLSVMAQALAAHQWPGELLAAAGHWQETAQSQLVLTRDQAHDLSYEGFCSISSESAQSELAIMGMNCLAAIKIGPGQSPAARDFVEYTLSYAFFVGCLSRFLVDHANDSELESKLRDFMGSNNPDDLKVEEDEGMRIFRAKPMFSIYGSRPDVVLAIQ